eukprot:EG_transcript_18177
MQCSGRKVQLTLIAAALVCCNTVASPPSSYRSKELPATLPTQSGMHSSTDSAGLCFAARVVARCTVFSPLLLRLQHDVPWWASQRNLPVAPFRNLDRLSVSHKINTYTLHCFPCCHGSPTLPTAPCYVLLDSWKPCPSTPECALIALLDMVEPVCRQFNPST